MMLELAAIVIVAAVALTFFSDATSRVVRMTRAVPRREQGKIRVAETH